MSYGSGDMVYRGWHYKINFVKGNQAEFERLMRLFVLTEPLDIERVPASNRYLYMVFNDATKNRPQLTSMGMYTSRLARLVAAAGTIHQPMRFQVDGVTLRFRRVYGALHYDLQQLIDSATPRDKMNAARDLREWLAANGFEVDQFLPKVTVEKIV